jgi:H+-transporting ATPase
MYLKLSVAGHLTIFLTRTRGPFWSIRPALVLWIAVLGTQIVATLIAVYGLFMTPLGWGWAAFVWGYALVWFLVNDRVKLLAYRVFDPTAAPLLSKKPADMTPQIAKRAYELYEQGGRQDGHADQDWVKAEQEVRKDEAKTEPQPESKAETPAGLTQQIAKRAHELYEERVSQDSGEVQDWEKAEREIRKDEPRK